ncbi:MAG: hypothetical protein K1X89_23860 [Myxococcaceae bacterium]|nr:hypothetical protein [Myxococcaceae bacterium]
MKLFVGVLAAALLCLTMTAAAGCSSSGGSSGGGSGSTGGGSGSSGGGDASGGGSGSSGGGTASSGGGTESSGGGTAGSGGGTASTGGGAAFMVPKGLLVYSDNPSVAKKSIYLVGTGGALPTTAKEVTPSAQSYSAEFPTFAKDGRVLYSKTSGSAPGFTSSIRVIGQDGMNDTQIFDCSGVMDGSFCTFALQASDDLIYFEQISADIASSTLTSKIKKIAITGGSASDVLSLPPGCTAGDFFSNADRTQLAVRTRGTNCAVPAYLVIPVTGTIGSAVAISGSNSLSFSGAGDKVVLGAYASGTVAFTIQAFDGTGSMPLGTYDMPPSYLVRFTADEKFAFSSDFTGVKGLSLAAMGNTAMDLSEVSSKIQYFSWVPTN